MVATWVADAIKITRKERKKAQDVVRLRWIVTAENVTRRTGRRVIGNCHDDEGKVRDTELPCALGGSFVLG